MNSATSAKETFVAPTAASSEERIAMSHQRYAEDRLVCSLAEPALDLADAGGKAANLSGMVRAGLPVPPGFVVLTAAYRAFVDIYALAPLIEAHWRALDPADVANLEDAAAAIRAAFQAAPFPPVLAEPLLAAYAALGDNAAVAVRSSATAEDLPHASFAGQQDTFLNIAGADALLDAVKRCWGSLWTARAMAYRARQGIAPEQVSLAIVVQEMIAADAAGVMFTVDPVSGADKEMLINATWGLGDALVAGRVNPDTIIADKRTGAIKSVEVGDKAIMTTPAAVGTVEAAVDPARRSQPALTTDQVAELVHFGRTLESLFGGAQDVEWAVMGDQVLLLQSRPVTTIAAPAGPPGDDAWPEHAHFPAQPFDFWTQQDLGERWPDPVTPLTWSISEPMTQISMERAVAGLKAPYAGKIRWCRRAYGHAYLNEGALLFVYTDGFGMPLQMLGGGLTHPGAQPARAEKWQPGKVLRHLPWYWQVATGWERNVARFEADFPTIDRWVDEFMARDLSGEPDGVLLDEARAVWFARVLESIGYHTNTTSLSMAALSQMEKLLDEQISDAALAHTLAGGLSGVIAAEIAPDLWAMAQTLRSLGLAEIILTQTPTDALATLRAEDAAKPFVAQLGRFLQRHGHRCMVEAELLHPRWAEAPEQVIQSLATYVQMETAPVAVNMDAARRRDEATVAVEARLNWWQRRRFRNTLARLHRFTRLRDNGQHYIVKLLLPMRCLYAELGRRWAERGWLQTAADIFFLVEEELSAVIAAGDPAAAGLDLRLTVAERRAAYTYWFTQPAPDALDAHGAPVTMRALTGDVLTGMAASPGEVEGRARVVMTPAGASALQPGDILVTRATDPGWTPVFSIIGGAVLEIGGTLSHGAIVAREYGLPAVVNVPQATQRIQDGQMIRVDGTNGRVWLLTVGTAGTDMARST
jgi:pyruvate,water dikinase